ncbi:collagen alpha-6(VI) chain-like [Argopecten irradians]|uniref:collagen alpha-6(VI) chain-like n=1 Tax=Argopecten irradians TaxID=31199 RepID=UPI003720AFE4
MSSRWLVVFWELVCLLSESQSSSCLNGWKGYNHHCYKLFTNTKTWYDAKNDCINHGGNLVKIEKSAENFWLKNNQFTQEDPWIGAYTSSHVNWLWVSDNSDVVYNDWRTPQPDDSDGNEDCVQMYTHGWNDLDCTKSCPYICEKEDDCRPGPADILFIMDTSYRNDKQLNDSKVSVKAIVNKLSIGADDFLAAVMTYSFEAKIEFSFDTFTDKASMISSIDSITGILGPSYLDKALDKSNEVFNILSTYGARPDVHRYIIIVSDGMSTYRRKAIHEARTLQSQGIRIFVIGNGEQVDQIEQLQLASSSKYISPAGREDDITNAILMETVNSDCKDCSLHTATDILVLVDVSMHQMSLQLTLDDLSDLEDKALNYNPNIHVSMATFDFTAQLKFTFNHFTVKDDVILNSQIGIATTNRMSNISAALAFSRHTGFTGSRADARKMLVVFSNEGWTDLDDVRHQRQALNKDNVTVAFVTVGRYADLDSAYSVSEKPSHVYYIESHADLVRFQALVAQTSHVYCPDNIFNIRQ